MVDIATGLFQGGMATNRLARERTDVLKSQVRLNEREAVLKRETAARKLISEGLKVTREELNDVIKVAAEAKANGATPEQLAKVRRYIEGIGIQSGVPGVGGVDQGKRATIPGAAPLVQSALSRFDATVGATPAKTASGMFEGTGMEAQSANIAIGLVDLARQGTPLSQAQKSAYSIAYAKLTEPRVVGSPTTGFSIVQPTLNPQQFPPPHEIGAAPPPQPAGIVPEQLPDSMAQTAPSTTPGTTVTPLAGAQRKPANEAGRSQMVLQGARTAVQVKDAVVNPDGTVNSGLVLAMATNFPGTEGRKIRAQIEDALAAKLRLETGATANEQEIQNMADRFMPSLFDSDATTRDKMNRLVEFFSGALRQTDPEAFEQFTARAREEGVIPEPPADEPGAEFQGFDPSTGGAVFKRPNDTFFIIRAPERATGE